MTDIITRARDYLLTPANIGDQQLSRILDSILGHSVDAADLYFQAMRHESWVLEDGIVKEGSFNVDRGVGVRAMSGEKTGFAYSNEIILPALGAGCRGCQEYCPFRVSSSKFRHGNGASHWLFIVPIILSIP